jgi:hypothetical protein
VTVTSTVRNRSSTTCSYASYTFGSSFKDPAGRPLTGSGLVADAFADTPFVPGQTFHHSATWDQRSCPEPTCGQAAPGTYSVVVTWGFPGGPYAVTLSFALS